MTYYLALLMADFCNSVIMILSQLSDLFSVLMQSCRLFFSLPQPHTCCDTTGLLGIWTRVLPLIEDWWLVKWTLKTLPFYLANTEAGLFVLFYHGGRW